MATLKTKAFPSKRTSGEREVLLPPPSTARSLVPAHDTLPPTEDVERHDTIPAPTWFGDTLEPLIPRAGGVPRSKI